ncbi:hypothetical protein QE152_g15163 [Popillia japonica]|uniref:Uncharacterized protein n=1 Tax=Popillia japonica TaxID=7064 RepID=A0AAW1L6T6_POPJA
MYSARWLTVYNANVLSVIYYKILNLKRLLNVTESVNSKLEKVIKCNGKCNNFIHYSCTSFKPTELKFFEVNIRNIKWHCDECCVCGKETKSDKSDQLKLEDMNRKLDAIMNVISEQNIKIEKHTNILSNLQSEEQPKRSIKPMRETTLRPTTRSRSSTTDVTEEFSKLYTKLTNSQQQVDRVRERRNEDSLEKAKTNTKLAKNKEPLSENETE